MVRNLLNYSTSWKPRPRRTAVYVGEPAGLEFLKSAGITASSYESGKLAADQVLIASPQSGPIVQRDSKLIAEWLDHGGRLLAIGLNDDEAHCLPLPEIHLKKAEHIATFFEPPSVESFFAGIGPADVHNRDPRELPLVTAGASVLGDGVLAETKDGRVAFCQLAPWQFGTSQQPNLRKTFRRTSFAVTRILANLGVAGSPPIAERFHNPVEPTYPQPRWQTGLYLDQPEEWDYPYRFFRW